MDLADCGFEPGSRCRRELPVDWKSMSTPNEHDTGTRGTTGALPWAQRAFMVLAERARRLSAPEGEDARRVPGDHTDPALDGIPDLLRLGGEPLAVDDVLLGCRLPIDLLGLDAMEERMSLFAEFDPLAYPEDFLLDESGGN